MTTHCLFFLVLLFSCTNKRVESTNCAQIKQISITDKFSQTPVYKETLVTGDTTLSNFCREIQALQPVTKEPIVKANFGFYILDIVYKDGSKDVIEIIYTKYDGVIIRLEGKYYKNDELDSVMRGYLAPKEWKG